MGDSTNLYRWRPHPWHGLEVGRRWQFGVMYRSQFASSLVVLGVEQ